MVSLYETTVEAYLRHLTILQSLLKKGQEHCDEYGIDEDVLTTARLAPDMEPLWFQIKVITNIARSGVFTPTWGWTSTGTDPTPAMNFAEMHERLQGTIDHLKGLPRPTPEQENVATEAEYKFHPSGIPNRGPEFRFGSATALLTQFVWPNFYFHMSTAYDILRHKGVSLGKQNFLGAGVVSFS